MMRGIRSGIGCDSLPAYLGKSLVFIVFVYLAAQFGSLFRFDGSSVSLLCLMTGGAVAGLLLLGRRYWPALLLATFGATLATGVSTNSAMLMALGVGFGALAAISMWRYLCDDLITLESLRDLLYLSIFAALGNSTIFACFATAASVSDARLAGHSLYDTWLLWWVGGVNRLVRNTPFPADFVLPAVFFGAGSTPWPV